MLEPYYDAFCVLNGRRQSGMAEQPLLISEIIAYSQRHLFDTDYIFFERAMIELDEEYMTHIVEKHKKEQAQEREGRPGK